MPFLARIDSLVGVNEKYSHPPARAGRSRPGKVWLMAAGLFRRLLALGERFGQPFASRRISIAAVTYVSRRKRNRDACRRAAGHRDSHEKNEHVSHRPIQRRALA